MFEGFSPRTIDFLCNLGLNNEKTWFDTHKQEFQEVLQLPMKALGQAVFEKVSKEHNGHGFIHKVSRIYRDAHYLRAGEGPYRTNLWFSIEKPTAGEWTDTPVFWFDLGPENWSSGMGYGGARADTIAKFRNKIDKNPNKFEQLVAFLNKQDEFTLEGKEYVRKKIAPSAKTTAWYNKKSFSIIHRQMNDKELFSPALKDRIADGMLSLMPIYEYLIAL